VGGGGVILRWDGTSWSVVENRSVVESPISDVGFSSVDMLSSDEGWIVGGTSGGDGVILRWDGTSWSVVESPISDASFSLVDMLSSNEGWIVGGELEALEGIENEGASRELKESGVILRWDGTRWSVFEPPTYNWLPWTFTGITIAVAALLIVVLYRKRKLGARPEKSHEGRKAKARISESFT